MNLTPETLKLWREKIATAGGLFDCSIAELEEIIIAVIDGLEFERGVSKGHCEEKIQVLQKLNIAIEALEKIVAIEDLPAYPEDLKTSYGHFWQTAFSLAKEALTKLRG